MQKEVLALENELRNEQDLEIDLKTLFYKVKSLWLVVVMGILIGTIVMVVYSAFLKTPVYQSTSQIYIRGNSQTVSLQDLQLGSQLTNDYEILFKSRPNMEKVISTLHLEYSANELKNMITISNPSDTRILNVAVTADDPNLARDIANAVVEQGMNNIREIDSQEPYVVEKAIANADPIGKSLLTMAIIGALLGFVVSVGGISVKFIVSDTIQSVDDIENSLGLPVLAVVPEDKSLSYAKKKYLKKK